MNCQIKPENISIFTNILKNYKFLSSHELQCCILKNRLLTNGESTNSAFRVASVTANRVLMDVEKRAPTDG